MAEETKSLEALEAVILEAMEPIEEKFEEALRLVHEHGAQEEREAVARWLRDATFDPIDPLGSAADRIEAGVHRKEADRVE